MSNYSNAFAEVYVILNELDYEDYEKIPQDVLDAISENRNKDYEFEIDENVELKDNNLLPETRAILFKLYRDYLVSEEQRQKIIKMQNEERRKIEIRKSEQYNEKDIFENNKNNHVNLQEIKSKELTDLTEVKKENFIKKIINRILSFFDR